MKKLIISADDAGHCERTNKAIISGTESGIITSIGIMPNMPGFESVISNLNKNSDIGLHFNITEGKALTNASLLCDENGNFNKGFLNLLLIQNDKEVLKQIKDELRAQTEKLLQYGKISHIDSHRHIHSIPKIFDIVTETAVEYGIKYIRTQNEPFYIVPGKIFNIKFPINIVKHILLNTLTDINKKKLNNSDIKTNDNFIGVLYTGYTDEESISKGLKHIKNGLTEVIFHPYIPEDLEYTNKLNNYREFLITKNPKFKEKILKSDFELTTFAD